MSAHLFAQTATITGTVRSNDGEFVPGAHVSLNGNAVIITNTKGQFRFNQVASGLHTLSASFIGFKQAQKSFTVERNQKLTINLILEEEATELSEITVTAKSEASQLKESVNSVALLDVKPFHNRSINTPDLLNTISGVQVRQSGGVGNSTDISIQGLSGRQVKLFVDGIPMDFLLPVEELGVGASLNMFPVNLMERMEVYKGAVPVTLGADALGGAINIVTRKDFKDYVEASIGHSSFNTWRSTFSSRKLFASGLTVGFSTFYTSSDNSYQVDDVKVVNEFGNPESISTNKFHDRFRSYLLKGELGIINKSWVDRLMLGFSYGDLYDEIQHNFEMRQPYGQALNTAKTYNTSLQYEKFGLVNKLDLSAYLGHSRIETTFIDTTRNIYNWRGEIIGKKTSGGEITNSQNNLNYKGDNYTGRISLNYHLSDNSRLTFNTVVSHFKRTGSDTVASKFYGEDYFGEPVYINKLVAGLGLEQEFLNGKITSSTGLKAYQYNSEGFIVENGESNTIKQERFQPGFSQAFKWQVNEKLLNKASYEYATRMPDRVETLGDFSSAINANPGLKPETSHNINIGPLYKLSKWTLELNGFYRNVSDIIILQAVPPPVLSKYENLLKTSITGVEGEVIYKPFQWLSIRTNATYQDLRNRSKKENAGVSSDRYYGIRLPNKPYFFSNGEIQFQQEDLFKSNDQLQLWWSTSYVEEFYRYWEIDGRKEDKLTIPSQWLQNIGLSYTNWKKNLTLTLESQNIFNAKAYDNFRVQKPGRSWHIKLRLFLSKT
ncbi:TonB-dependent receptor domain-containing protein [Roseivirga pacifica]|uniref:TonB-dependent receptor n=1 Tax=Roseivirga pacifica TaxID=1267423 RepID=UPI003BAE84D2